MDQNAKTSYQAHNNHLISYIPKRRRDVMCLRGLLSLSLAAPILPALATTRWEIQAGPSYMDCTSTPAVFLESVFNEQRLGSSRFTWSPDVSLGWIDGRDVQRFRYGEIGRAHV